MDVGGKCKKCLRGIITRIRGERGEVGKERCEERDERRDG